MNTTLPRIPQQTTLRIIDANLNRASEGLRVIEDIARLALNNVTLSERLKNMRHDMVEFDLAVNSLLIGSRDVDGDVGANLVAPESLQKDLPLSAVANSRRVQESLRTLEELSRTLKISSIPEPETFRQFRFELYSIERKLLSGLLREDKRKRIFGLCAIIDTLALKGRKHLEVTEQVIKGGAKTIQLRDKVLSKKELFAIAMNIKKICSTHNILFIVNDYLDIALACSADGVHLGKNDLPTHVARRLLPIDMILGRSVNTVEQAVDAESEGADYIGLGSIYHTLSKEKAVVITPSRIAEVRKAVNIPIMAIGGINKDNALEVIDAGADSIAVISAILKSQQPEKAAGQIVNAIGAVHARNN